MILSELFNIKNYKWTGPLTATFVAGQDRTFTVSFIRVNSNRYPTQYVVYEVEFADENGELAATGNGNQFEVFSNCMAIISDFIMRNKIDILIIAGDVDEMSRVKLFSRLSRMIAKKHNGEVDYYTKNGYTNYEISFGD